MKNTSKYISLIMRHKPETIGITLDEHGWADVSELQVVRLGAFGLGRRAQDDGGIAVQGYPPGGVHTCVKSTVAQGLGLRSPRDYKCREEQ